ncbi:hypothetical protein [Polynucleobacter sp. UK-Kesae-W10]|uniref:hypothetical protein n=1 Tax=Polynucleobacter sp. UK-Kesae-W10 TaxID=1819738 RepID=UPI001C0E6501|nr:hypothetical protein [Polynucleobacter sp. UK-Kesae-W10]MBU3577556.1 hypothetical protein [Polynucleobacter sp. UK-Kesae-W10]
MSRSGYSDDIDNHWNHIMWRGRVASSIRGKRGQAMLSELLTALDAMPDKRLYPNSFAQATGEYCTLGVLGAARGTKMDDLGDAEDGCDERIVAERFGVAAPLVQEIMYMNDEWIGDFKFVDVEICGPSLPHYPHWGRHTRSVRMPDETAPSRRWKMMRNWVSEQIKDKAVA